MIQNPCTYEDIGRAVLANDPGETITTDDDKLAEYVQTTYGINLSRGHRDSQAVKLMHCITCLRASEKPVNDCLLLH